MGFNPNGPVVKLCLAGVGRAEAGRPDEAGNLFLQAWNKAGNDFEKFLTAYFVGRSRKAISERLKWFEAALQFALTAGTPSAGSALPTLYAKIARCYEQLGASDKAEKNHELAASLQGHPPDKGPFYHGTKANLPLGGLLTAGGSSNYKAELKMNHIYFTALVNGAGLAAALAKGNGRERVYRVQPTGAFENDPNVTDKKFPGNPTRSYRSQAPLRITGEAADWVGLTREELHEWRKKLARSKREIIN
jgi:rifampin ADP-ribosylating transferase